MVEEQINQTIDQLVFFLIFPRYMEDAFLVNYTIPLIRKAFVCICHDFLIAKLNAYGSSQKCTVAYLLLS